MQNLPASEGATLPGIRIWACLLVPQVPELAGRGNGGRNENAIIKNVIKEHEDFEDEALGFVKQEEGMNDFGLPPGSPQAPVPDLQATDDEDEDLDPDTDQTSADDGDQCIKCCIDLGESGTQCDLVPSKRLANEEVCSSILSKPIE
jgi:hypothetical protein